MSKIDRCVFNKGKKEEEKEENGFKFGATQSNSDENQKNKKPVATKRWNRFNSLFFINVT